MKRICSVFFAVMIIALLAMPAYAQSPAPDVTVRIISPDAVEMKPIYTGDLTVEITNSGSAAIDDLICYLSIVDVGRGLSYNVDEFGPQAYQSRALTLAAGETATVVIPVKVSYVGDFRFTVTAIDLDAGTAYASQPLAVNMLTASELNRPLATVVAVVMPVLCIALTLYLFRRRRVLWSNA